MRRQNIIIAGVGGQGVVSAATILAGAALHDGLNVTQSEVHGMAQRGGAVYSHVRIGEGRVFAPLIMVGKADMIIGLEPLEALRRARWLSTRGWSVVNLCPSGDDVAGYPDVDTLRADLKAATAGLFIDASALTCTLGSVRSLNLAMLGAASSRLLVSRAGLIDGIRAKFESKGPAVVASALDAFYAGERVAGAGEGTTA
jgi:indolepyruvate ferredoxin oxidoreductase beta subunit